MSSSSPTTPLTEMPACPLAADFPRFPVGIAPRRACSQINVGGVLVGGNAPVSVQSMLVNDTRDVQESITQIKRLAEAGCEIIRLAVPDNEAAEALKRIVPASPIPVVADIHFDYRLALAAAANGVHAIRINPGNIGRREFTQAVVKACKERQLPIRIGVNGGSVEPSLKSQYPGQRVRQLVESALLNAQWLEAEDFTHFAISVKASDPLEAVAAYREVASRCTYPLHLGVTEAGTLKRGLIKSAMALGMLLGEGIGDTIRISLTADSIEEVLAGHELLRSLGLRKEGVNLISCPACGRCEVDLHGLTSQVEALLSKVDVPITVAVMGCFVNGPGEAEQADLGIAGGIGHYYVFRGEQRVMKVSEAEALPVFMAELEKVIADYKAAHPAAPKAPATLRKG